MKARTLPLKFLVALMIVAASAATAGEGYKLPPQEIVDILDAPPDPSVSVSPDRRYLVFTHRRAIPSVAELSAPMERLAGRRYNALNNTFHGPTTAIGLSIRLLETGQERQVELPEGTFPGWLSWAPDGRSAVFTSKSETSVSLWHLDVDSAKASLLLEQGINGLHGTGAWMPDGQRLLLAMLPADRGTKPERPALPDGPAIQETRGNKTPVRTYQDLLKDKHDEEVFDWLRTSQLMMLDLESGRMSPFGEPGIFQGFRPAPGGDYVLVRRVQKPYSYLQSEPSFPSTVEVWNLEGERVAVISDLPLIENVPIGGVHTGRRRIQWQPSHPARLVWVRALDGGDPKAEVPHRDKIMAQTAPFDDEPVEVIRLEDRSHFYFGITWTSEAELAFVKEYDRDEKLEREWLVDFGDAGAEARLVRERFTQDRYSNPGRMVTKPDETGRRVVHVHDGAVFLSGSGATPEGDRPFLRRMDLGTFETTELWRSAGESYESVVDIVAPDASRFITRYQDKTVPANYYVRTLAGERTKLTDFKDPHPQLSGIEKQLIKYKRADGVELSSTLYLPPGYEEGDQLPVIVWAYPREFNSASHAGQVAGSPNTFSRIGGYSIKFLLMQGYAIMDRATMPVVGDDPETVNDTFIEQIVMSAQAAIDKAVEMGFGERHRFGVGGHSYGAFMTANLLAHSDLFAAGVARSGAYNRTLTPFGFQSERRPYWEAPEAYYQLSPFMHADELDEPILFIHGELDNNSGTYPIQSERMFHAVKGNGGTARLVMLPYESHGYRGRESILHTLAEMIEWFDEHVKNAELPEEADAEPELEEAAE